MIVGIILYVYVYIDFFLVLIFSPTSIYIDLYQICSKTKKLLMI